MNKAATAYIALGSNMGDRLEAMRGAVALVGQCEGVFLDYGSDVASLYETEPVDGPAGQGKYLNSAMRVRTSLESAPLMEALLEIERALGRQRAVRWESRVIDLDLLLYGQLQYLSPTLAIPHPRMHQRRFVLEPLAEIAGDLLHPVLEMTIGELSRGLRKTSNQEVKRVFGPEWTELLRRFQE